MPCRVECVPLERWREGLDLVRCASFACSAALSCLGSRLAAAATDSSWSACWAATQPLPHTLLAGRLLSSCCWAPPSCACLQYNREKRNYKVLLTNYPDDVCL